MNRDPLSQYKILCFEMYRREKDISLEDAILLFDKYQVFTYLSECYEEWKHLEVNALVENIEKYINSKR